jgi:predicted nucleic acid-binding protein
MKRAVNLRLEESVIVSLNRLSDALHVALKKSGTIIADMDLMIASIAIENNCTLLTNNLKHFERISELRVVGLEG